MLSLIIALLLSPNSYADTEYREPANVAREQAWLDAGTYGCIGTIKAMTTSSSGATVTKTAVQWNEGNDYTLVAKRSNGETCYCNFSNHPLSWKEINLRCEVSL